MSNPSSERPWTEDEKYTLLTEIMKKAGIHSSNLVKMIKDFRIQPSWQDIPLPQGRSLNSCQTEYTSMSQQQQHLQQQLLQQQPQPPPNTTQFPFPPLRHEPSAPPIAPMGPGHQRKRPLSYSSDRPPSLAPAPRPIQPRPSSVSYSSESGASILSPSLESVTSRGEPPRKRGRPSKAETERRKLAAEARGEVYPPARRSDSNKSKISSAPTSPAGVETGNALFSPQASMQIDTPRPDSRYAPPGRTIAPLQNVDDRAREMPGRDPGPGYRELPRPAEVRQTLPSPQALQLGHRDPIPRMDIGERRFEPLQNRMPFITSQRPPLPEHARRDQPPASISEVPMSTSIEKRPG